MGVYNNCTVSFENIPKGFIVIELLACVTSKAVYCSYKYNNSKHYCNQVWIKFLNN